MRWHRDISDKDCWPIPLRHLDPERHVWIIDYDADEYIVMLRQFRVYLLTCRPTGQRYVGVTEGHPADRLRDHAITAFHPKRRKTLVQKAIAEHGVDAFAVETIGVANSVSEAMGLERNLICQYGTLAEDGGLNARVGGGHVGPTRIGYHYLQLYERGEARVVQRIPRILKGKRKKGVAPGGGVSGAVSHLRLVKPEQPAGEVDVFADIPHIKILRKLKRLTKRRLVIAPKK